MTVDEVTTPDPLKSELDRMKRVEKAMKIKKARLQAQQAQNKIRNLHKSLNRPLS